MNQSVSALRFSVACSYLATTPDSIIQQKKILARSLEGHADSAELWAQIKRHRVYALAAEVLNRYDKTTAMSAYYPTLIEKAHAVRLQGLRQHAVTLQLQDDLKKAHISSYILKGPQLAQKLYGDVGLRHSKDIDVIVLPDDLSKAIRVLQQSGWALLEVPVWIEHPVYRYLAKNLFWDFRLQHHATGYMLELHWRFEKMPSSNMEKIWWKYWQSDTETAWLAEMLYLCLHGAGSGWPRLKWLGDIRMCLEHYPDMWQRLIPLANELNMREILAQTILLLEWLYEVKPNEMAQSLIDSEPNARKLALDALECMVAPENNTQTLSDLLRTRRYVKKLSQRYPFLDRLKEGLLFYAVPGKDIAKLDWPWISLPVLPLIRIISFLRRRIFCL